jgi:hypothetical protein
VKEGEMGSSCSTYKKKEKSLRVLVGKPEENRPLGRPRSRWGNNIKMNLKEIIWEGMDWILQTHDSYD